LHDAEASFTAFLSVSLKENLTDVILQLCVLYSKHPWLITRKHDLLWKTIMYLLDSDNVVAAIPLIELATTIGIYPQLTVGKRPHDGELCLWDFMSQAEIYALLCVYLHAVRSQFEFQESLSFKITGKRCPSSPKPWLCQPSVDCDMFYDRVESALTDNLALSPTNFRRTGDYEWCVMIENLSRILAAVSKDHPSRRPSGGGRYVSSAAEKRRSSEVRCSADTERRSSQSSRSDNFATPKKTLLPTPSVKPQALHLAAVPHTVPVSKSLQSSIGVPRSTIVPVPPLFPHVSPPSQSLHNNQYGLAAVFQAASSSSVTSTIALTCALPLPPLAGCYNVPPPNYPGSVPFHSVEPCQTVVTTVSSSVLGAYVPVPSGPIHTSSNSSGSFPVPSRKAVTGSSMLLSSTNACVLPVTSPVTFPPPQGSYQFSTAAAVTPVQSWTSTPVTECQMSAAGKLH